jgi:phosphoglycolate phosphatase
MDNLVRKDKQSTLEIINHAVQRGKIQYALFDFDGTISLIREGWQGIMKPMMVEILLDTPHHEERDLIEKVVDEYIARLTGKQTIYQMIQLCDEISSRGGTPQDPLYYKNVYHDRLKKQIQYRIDALKNGKENPEEHVVPGSINWLKVLQNRGIVCYLASGTDEKYVLEESNLLGLDVYFEGIYGAQDDYQNFSKKIIIDSIIQKHKLHGANFVAFGDGYVEIEDTKLVGGIAIGVATDEKNRSGIDEWKRNRLISAGADVIIPDFRESDELEKYLFT